MQLYFLRHGQAEFGSGVSDHDRQLTPRGVERTRTAGRVLAALDLGITHIFSSPRVRALQTAEIVAEALGKEVDIRDEVNFGFDVDGVLELTRDLPEDANVMFVGHEPSMSVVVGRITGGVVEMKKGGLARVDLDDRGAPRGYLVWLIAPKVFDALGQA